MSETDVPAVDHETPPPGSRWSGRSVGIAILVLVLLCGGAAAALLISDDDDSDSDAAAPTSTTTDGPSTTVQGRTVAGPDSPTTSTPSTTLVVAGGTVTSAPATTEPPTEGPCGSGAMRVEPEPGSITFEQDRYHLPVAAAVVSQYDRAVEVTRLVVRVTFKDGSTVDVELDTAGVVIPPGDSHTYSGPTVTSESEPVSTEVPEFSYQEEGRPTCAASS